MLRILQERLGWFPSGFGLVVVVDDLGVLEEIHNLKERALTTKFLNPASKLGEAFLTSLQRKGISRDVWQGFLHHQVRPEGRPRHGACTSRAFHPWVQWPCMEEMGT